MRIFRILLLATGVMGCRQNPPEVTTSPASPIEESASQSGHSHVRGNKLLADVGSYHALLTARLSKEGHRLDVFFETTTRNPKPVALPLIVLKATVQIRAADGGVKEIEFVPATDSERPPGEPAGHASHFVAKTPWLNPDAEHRVIIRVRLDGEDEEARWNNFIPRKYALHSD
jgi:hypothetical protein